MLADERIKYNVVTRDGERESVTAFIDGREYVANRDHPKFREIIAALENFHTPRTTITGLFEAGTAIAGKFAHLSERVMVAGNQILFDGMRVDNSLTQAIVAFHNEGHDNFERLVLFLEKIETNPNEHSRQHLFRWLNQHRFAIAPDGDFIAYKGVNSNGRDPDDLVSSSSGQAFVNGQFTNGRIPTRPGTVIEMPRNKVTFDPRTGCSAGLHAGNWRYARNFASVTLRVKINPRDVVSVPVDSNDEKLRVCRYKVLDRVSAEDTSMLYVDEALRTLCVRSVEEKPSTTVSKATGTRKRTAKKAAGTIERKGGKLVATKKAAPKKATPVSKKAPAKKAGAVVKTKAPKHYEEFKREHFQVQPHRDLRWLAKEWGVNAGPNPTKDSLVPLLTREAAKRNRRLQAKAAGVKGTKIR